MRDLAIGDVILVVDSKGHVKPETVFLFSMRYTQSQWLHFGACTDVINFVK